MSAGAERVVACAALVALAGIPAVAVAAPVEPASPDDDQADGPGGAVDEDAEAGTSSDARPADAAMLEPPVVLPADAEARRKRHFGGFRAAETAKAVDRRARFCDTDAVTDRARELEADANNELRDERRKAYTRNNGAAAANVFLDGPGMSTGAERLAAAVNTKVDGVEAGITIAPLSLLPSADPARPHGWTLLLAALEEGKTRVGTGYGFTVGAQEDITEIVKRISCVDLERRKDAIAESVVGILDEDVLKAYGDLCESVVPTLSTTVDRRRLERLTKICAPSEPGDINLVGLVGNLENAKNATPKGNPLHIAMAAEADALAKLRAAQVGLTDLTHGIGDTKAFLQAYRYDRWKTTQVRIGGDLSLDFDRRQFGRRRLELDEAGEPGQLEELPRGEILAWRAGPSVTIKGGRSELMFGVAAGQAEVVGDDRLRFSVEPSMAFAWTLAFLDHRRIERHTAADADAEASTPPGRRRTRRKNRIPYLKREPRFSEDDGSLPARMIVGTRASFGVPLQPPSFQRDELNAASLLVHVDFVVSTKLMFRIGLPLTAKLVEQEANTDAEPDIEKRTVLRWTVPAFLTTVVSF